MGTMPVFGTIGAAPVFGTMPPGSAPVFGTMGASPVLGMMPVFGTIGAAPVFGTMPPGNAPVFGTIPCAGANKPPLLPSLSMLSWGLGAAEPPSSSAEMPNSSSNPKSMAESLSAAIAFPENIIPKMSAAKALRLKSFLL